jgi:hypothetical protein
VTKSSVRSEFGPRLNLIAVDGDVEFSAAELRDDEDCIVAGLGGAASL